MPEITCLICGGRREVGQCDINRGLGKYCSRRCYYESQKTRIAFNCAICGKPSYYFPSKPKGKYCSRECTALAKKKEDRVKGNYAYGSWRGAIRRCYERSCSNYRDYGGRGIRVCDKWRNNFAAFLEDMGHRPFAATLDRIDVNGNYEPENCRWATSLTQARNRRNTIMVTHDGQCMPLAEYAELRRVRYPSLFARVKKGMAPEEAADYLISRGCILA